MSVTVKMPAFLGSALVNGDTSGLTCSCGAEQWMAQDTTHTGQCDFRWLAGALAYCAPGHVVSTAPGCGEPHFSYHCDLPGWGRFGADMLDYVVLYPQESTMAPEQCDGCGEEHDLSDLAYEDCGSPADGSSGTGCTDHEGVRRLCDACWQSEGL
jgi:hypothetical protein